ncbi:metalloregulator ArsR/SmtB family transcription factor [Magnetovibrio sp.]|uniref:ArsR/SmtB family transcription factor n=1 Tax=Magnetovibrio sp. TaxID=2024836 RepID=UPI002F91F1DB
MNAIPNETIAADILGALGNETRLLVFRLLVRAGRDGLNIGQIQEHLGTAPSTLAHHIQTLVHAGLVLQTKKGREVICSANFDTMDALVAYLTDQCCKGFC